MSDSLFCVMLAAIQAVNLLGTAKMVLYFFLPEFISWNLTIAEMYSSLLFGYLVVLLGRDF